ncbi:acyltransferase [Chryseobacterium sp. MFBS3-17]|uniref:acyltransferase n=1 Tax=Chryseobacterium sp. MFBS3-17 TaxID=2886689 RepID=UPI001D0DE4B6|nr:acyltransferase [Chryseobacterium sp. MFBS3-17]MCC2591358.1 acyltransferase [Chryseobacterium sp. MFBS3-17]
MLKNIIKKYKKKFYSPEKYAKFLGVKIGDNCLISTKRFPTEAYLIEIGDYCRIANNVAFYTHGGLWSVRKKYNKKNLENFGKIKIGNYTYIGDDAKIMPGITIGNNVIVGAGSIVTKSIPDNVICAGNPAKIVGNIDDFVNKIENFNIPIHGKSAKEKKKILLALADNYFIRK